MKCRFTLNFCKETVVNPSTLTGIKNTDLKHADIFRTYDTNCFLFALNKEILGCPIFVEDSILLNNLSLLRCRCLRCHGYLGSDKRRATEASDWPLLISAAYQHLRMSYRPRELIDCHYLSFNTPTSTGTEPWWREKC